ncbi:DUF4383 domain-containing protein [Glycomyces buryatensis]|uniref:DUF4383 domain-containing protein n=1 Tax=Glycomyces buryatensis TaxID=2570927 RepID=A0A4S8QDY3_9ACTN|nr:DUF4383 domain-containing protein [Glycomyces buryatensis]THV42797.1 DUF4383 domain-containing protein [Glycomyces buryatensis]
MEATRHHHRARLKKWETAPVQDGAVIVGLAFVIVGVLGFLPGITTGFDGITFAGHESEAQLFGIFEVSVLHNLVHLFLGLLGMFMSWYVAGARLFLLGGGLLYLLLGIYGFFVGGSDAGNFLPMNTADDWLHVGFGVAMVALGVLLPWVPSRKPKPAPAERKERESW